MRTQIKGWNKQYKKTEVTRAEYEFNNPNFINVQVTEILTESHLVLIYPLYEILAVGECLHAF